MMRYNKIASSVALLLCLIGCGSDSSMDSISDTSHPQIPIPKYDDAGAYEQMKRSPMYERFHSFSTNAPADANQLLLEFGNYAWGGYSAILIVANSQIHQIYSYYPDSNGNGRFIERSEATRSWSVLVQELELLGIWETEDRLDFPADDASTAYLYLKNQGKEKRIAIYVPTEHQKVNAMIDSIEEVAFSYTNRDDD